MATKKIQIEYDINGKAIDVAIDKTLNLTQAAKALSAELKKTKEGSNEFKVLSTKLGDVQDGLARTKAKSTDLFGSLSMLPGPVGQFAQQMSAGIELLKVFTSFSLKDIKFQFGEVANDIGDITDNLIGASKEAEETSKQLSKLDVPKMTTPGGTTPSEVPAQKPTEKVDESSRKAETAATLAQTEAQTKLAASNNVLGTTNEQLTISNLRLSKATGRRLFDMAKGLEVDAQVIRSNNEIIASNTAKFQQAELELNLKIENNAITAEQIQLERQSIAALEQTTFALSNKNAALQIELETELARFSQKQRNTIAEFENTGAINLNTGAETVNTESKVVNNTVTKTQTLVTKAATVATELFSTALKLVPFLAVIAAIGLLVAYWQDLVDLITGATNVTKAYGEAQQGATKDLTDFNKKVYEQTNAIKLAKSGVGDKKEALKKYNDTLGETIGYAKNLTQAEYLMAKNTKIVVESIRLRAMANVFYAKAAEASAKAVSGEGVKPTFWQNTFNLMKSGANISMLIGNTTGSMLDNIKELNDKTTQFADEGDRLNKLAIESDKKRELLNKKPTEAKGGEKVDPLKEAQDKINANEAYQQSLDELVEAERQKSERVIEELKKEQEYKDKEHSREEIRIKNLQDLLDLFLKKKLIKQKEYDKQTLALQTEQTNLEKTFQADKIARELKTQEEITKLNALNATERMKIAQMERDVDAKSQKESLARTIEEIQNSGQDKIKAYDEVLENLIANGLMTAEEHDSKLIAFIKKINEQIANETDKATKDDAQKTKDAKLKKLDAELQFLDVRKSAVREGTHEYFDILREINAKAQERELESLDKTLMTETEYEKARTNIKLKYAKERADIDKQENRLRWQGVAQTLDQLSAVSNAIAAGLEDESKKSRKAFEQRKKLQVATAYMTAASGVIQILAQPSTLPSPFDWIVKTANVIALGVATGINIGKINGTTFEQAGGKDASSGFKSMRNYGDGGMIEGPLHSGGGVPITAEGGEAVMSRGSVAMFAPLLSAMNVMGGGTSFSKGAAGQAFFDNPKVSNPVQDSTTQVIKTYVVSNELTSEVEKQARLKALSTI